MYVSKKRLWAGLLLSGFVALLLVVDGGMKLFKLPVAVKSTVQLGFPDSAVAGIGIVLLTSTLLYLLTRTSILGAVLLTGYLGGAVSTHVRVSGSWFDVLFPVLVGGLVWGGLWLRDPRLNGLLPLRAKP